MEYKKTIIVSELLTYISALTEEMQRKKYSEYEIRTMNQIWKELLLYAETNQDAIFDENYRQSFLKNQYSEELEVRDSMYRITRAMNMLSDYIQFHVIFRQYSTLKTLFVKGHIEIFTLFLKEESRRGLSEGTLKVQRSRLLRLHDFLVDTGAESFAEVTQEQINIYIISLARFSSTYISESLRILRRLSDYAYQNGYCKKSFANSIPHVKNLRQQKLPSTFTENEINLILNSVDRANPIGKRNYAIFLTAARLGLRSGDLCALKFTDINWDTKIISFTQQKTKKFLSLPLPDDVGWAVIDYLKNGRPESDSNTIFISHRTPYGALETISNIIPKQMRIAGIKTLPNKRTGMHAFRHGLATSMLEKGIPLPIISQTLGHADISSTEIYLRISLKQLSLCALEVDL